MLIEGLSLFENLKGSYSSSRIWLNVRVDSLISEGLDCEVLISGPWDGGLRFAECGNSKCCHVIVSRI